MNCFPLGFTVLLVSVSAGLSAQASSPSFFLPSGEFGSGGRGASSRFELDGRLGAGVAWKHGTSTSFAMFGGFAATVDAATKGRPWVTGMRPLHPARNSAAALTVHGTELQLGTGATVKIGGRTATVTSRTRDSIRTALPRDVAPGWQSVEVTAAGVTTVLPRAVGVLPMVDVERPASSGSPFHITFRGTQGDRVMWAVAARKLPFRIRLDPFGFGFELDPAAMIVFAVTAVSDPSGKFELPLPAADWVGPFYVQALALSNGGGYRPGTFTNVIEF